MKMEAEYAVFAHVVRAVVLPNGTRELLRVEVEAVYPWGPDEIPPRGSIPADAAVALAIADETGERPASAHRWAVAEAFVAAAGRLPIDSPRIAGYRIYATYGPRPDDLKDAPTMTMAGYIAKRLVLACRS